jgi:hypothetical protein
VRHIDTPHTHTRHMLAAHLIRLVKCQAVSIVIGRAWPQLTCAHALRSQSAELPHTQHSWFVVAAPPREQAAIVHVARVKAG